MRHGTEEEGESASMKTLERPETERQLATDATGKGTPVARPDRGILDDYVARTAHLGWKDSKSPPLDHEAVIVAFEEDGAVRFVRTRYERAAGGWRERRLRGRRFWWIHDPPL
jgi:hypothetical protein